MMQDSKGNHIRKGKEIGSGGEATVFSVVKKPKFVAKIYHPHRLSIELENKIREMVAHPPTDEDYLKHKHISIAWPIEMLYENDQFCGFLMPKISDSYDLQAILDSLKQPPLHDAFSQRVFYRVLRNLAVCLQRLHEKGYVIGDLNTRNVRFNNDGFVSIIDCDSMQMKTDTGAIYFCEVNASDYTAPEYLNITSWNGVERVPNTDNYTFAYLVFQLLMYGQHPYSGRIVDPKIDPIDIKRFFQENSIFPFQDIAPYLRPKFAPKLTQLPALIQQMWIQAFTTRQRPTAGEWVTALIQVEARLQPCPNDPLHVYPSDGNCVVCSVHSTRTSMGLPVVKMIPVTTKKQTKKAQSTPTQAPLPVTNQKLQYRLWNNLVRLVSRAFGSVARKFGAGIKNIADMHQRASIRSQNAVIPSIPEVWQWVSAASETLLVFVYLLARMVKPIGKVALFVVLNVAAFLYWVVSDETGRIVGLIAAIVTGVWYVWW